MTDLGSDIHLHVFHLAVIQFCLLLCTRLLEIILDILQLVAEAQSMTLLV